MGISAEGLPEAGQRREPIGVWITQFDRGGIQCQIVGADQRIPAQKALDIGIIRKPCVKNNSCSGKEQQGGGERMLPEVAFEGYLLGAFQPTRLVAA